MEKIRLTADGVYNKLLNEDKILTLKGQISFYLGGIDIVVKQKDVVGNIMQEWIEGWLRKNNVDFALNDNTQMPPDFYLNPDNKKVELLEIKAFNYNGTPGFDIASFDMFEREISEKPYVLDTTYLIFGYDMSSDGIVTIKKMWKQKVWQITRPMRTRGGVEWAMNLQIKDGVVHKIRPAKWYVKQTKYEVFKSLQDFLSAIEETVYQNKDTRDDGAGWRQKMEKNYQAFYGESIRIPRWDDIKGNYFITPKKKSKVKQQNIQF